MKRVFKKVLVCILIICSLVGLMPHGRFLAAQESDFVFDAETGTITRYKGLNSGNLVIPSEFEGVEVKAIGDYAFYRCNGLTGGILIPEGVNTIGKYAFYGCTGLTGNLVIPEGVNTIGDSAFMGCTGLTGNLVIPESVISVGSSAFYNCKGLTGNLVIPEGVTTIGFYAFYNCKGLTGDLVISEGVTSIGFCAFYYCTGISDVYFYGDAPSFVGANAFENSNTDLVIYYKKDAKGFTSPEWNEHKSEALDTLPDIPEIKVSVVFDSTGGSSVEDQYVKYNSMAEVPQPPQKEGHVFVNWYEDKALTIVFDFNTKITSDKTLYAKWELTADLTVKIEGHGSVYNWKYGDVKTFVLGSNVTITAVDNKDSYFLYWKNSGGRILSTNPEYAFVIGCDETITAVFAEKDKHLVTFKNGDGEIIKLVYVIVGSIVEFPKEPSKYGYTFVGWDKTAEEIKESKDDIVVTALFKKNEETVTISVYGGSGTGEYKIKDYVTVVADVPEEGQMFSHWVDDSGNILCYDATYKFYAVRDINLTAVFIDESGVVEQKASIAITNITKLEGKLSFVAERIVPEGSTIVSHGIILTNNSSTGISETDFIIGATDVLKGTAKTTQLVGTFVLSKSAVPGETWYARGFVIYKDSDGKIITVYSNIKEETLN